MTASFIEVLTDRVRTVSAALEDVRRREEAVRSEYGEKLREISEEATRLEAELRHLGALLALEGGGQQAAEIERLLAREGPAMPVDLREEVYMLLSSGREAMHYTQIAEQLTLRGVHIPGKDPAKNLVAHIHNDPRLRRPRRGFYGLSEWYPADMKTVGTRRANSRKASARRRRGARQAKGE